MIMFSTKTSVILNFNSYKKVDLKRKFLFFNKVIFRFLQISIFTLSVHKFDTLISLLRSPFVHKRSFEQFFYSFYKCKMKFFYFGEFISPLRIFVNAFLNFALFSKFISKVETIDNSSFFF